MNNQDNLAGIDEVAAIGFEKDLTIYRLKKAVTLLQDENQRLQRENSTLKASGEDKVCKQKVKGG